MKLQIPYDDLRSWLDLAGEVGEVRAVEGASWQEDIRYGRGITEPHRSSAGGPL